MKQQEDLRQFSLEIRQSSLCCSTRIISTLGLVNDRIIEKTLFLFFFLKKHMYIILNYMPTAWYLTEGVCDVLTIIARRWENTIILNIKDWITERCGLAIFLEKITYLVNSREPFGISIFNVVTC